MTDRRPIRRAPIAALVAAIAVSAVAVWLAARSRDASSIAPGTVTENVDESRPVALEPVDAASATSSSASSAKRDESQAASAPGSDNAPRVDRAPTARFRGRIVYEATREPVPWCVVAVRAPGQTTELRIADEQGHFATAFEYAATKLDVLAWDGPEPVYNWTGAQSVEHIPTNPTEVEVAVRAWPTIIVDGGMPEGRDPRRWHFQLGACTWFSEARVTRSHTLLWRNHPDPTGWGIDPLDELRRIGPPWWLVIDDEQLDLCCSMMLDRIEGVLHVSPVWQKRGGLLVALRTESSPRPDYRVRARLRPVLTAADNQTHSGNLKSGWIRLDHLRPGEFVLDVTSQFCATAHLAVTIHPDEVTNVEALLACEPATDSIRGVIASDSGKHREDMARWVELRSHESGVVLANSSIHWTSENGAAIGRFETGPLPAHEYELSLESSATFATRPATPLVVRPGDEVQLTLLDRAPKVEIDIGFDVFDKSTKTPIDDFYVEAHTPQFSGSQPAHAHTVVLDDVPQVWPVTWRVSCDGYAFVDGTLETASRSWTVDGRRRWVRIELERGMRVSVIVRADEGFSNDETPLAGAAVLVDDREVGRTDKRGKFETLLLSPPRSIDVKYLNWRHSPWRRSHAIKSAPVRLDREIEFTLEPP